MAHRDEDRWLASIDEQADYVQIREAGLNTRELVHLIGRLNIGPKVLVNDRTDVAIACGTAGVHVRGGSVTPETIRKIAPPGFVISVACHSADDVRNAAGADYALLAPIFQPLSKSSGGKPLGLATLEEIVRISPVPVIALGGITVSNIAACIEAGAAGVAGISLFRRCVNVE